MPSTPVHFLKRLFEKGKSPLATSIHHLLDLLLFDMASGMISSLKEKYFWIVLCPSNKIGSAITSSYALLLASSITFESSNFVQSNFRIVYIIVNKTFWIEYVKYFYRTIIYPVEMVWCDEVCQSVLHAIQYYA